MNLIVQQTPSAQTRRPETFRELLHLRTTRVDPYKPGDKLKVQRQLQEMGAPVAETFRVFNGASEINSAGLPDAFVLKPHGMTAKRGVHLLHRMTGEDLFWCAMEKKPFSITELQTEYGTWEELWKSKRRKGAFKIIAEELIKGARDTGDVPLDYKFYVFDGEVRLITQTDRNVTPSVMYFWDKSFSNTAPPMSLLTPNPKKAKLGAPIIPKHADEMLALASRVSRAIRTPFIRVDMYDSVRGPIVGELTGRPGGAYYGGLYKLSPAYDRDLAESWFSAAARLGQEVGEIGVNEKVPARASKMPKTAGKGRRAG